MEDTYPTQAPQAREAPILSAFVDLAHITEVLETRVQGLDNRLASIMPGGPRRADASINEKMIGPDVPTPVQSTLTRDLQSLKSRLQRVDGYLLEILDSIEV